MKSCPFCGEQIKDAAVKCRYCQRDLAPSDSASQGEATPPIARKQYRERRLERAARRTVESTEGTQLSGLREFFAFLGIVAGFFVLLTIPGWYGIRAWRRYGRGEPSSIRSYYLFGIVVAAFIAFAVVMGVVANLGGETTVASSNTLSDPVPSSLTVIFTVPSSIDGIPHLLDARTRQQMKSVREKMPSGSLVEAYGFSQPGFVLLAFPLPGQADEMVQAASADLAGAIPDLASTIQETIGGVTVVCTAFISPDRSQQICGWGGGVEATSGFVMSSPQYSTRQALTFTEDAVASI